MTTMQVKEDLARSQPGPGAYDPKNQTFTGRGGGISKAAPLNFLEVEMRRYA